MTILGRIVIRVSSAIAVLLVMAGIPAGLLRFVGSPLPRSLPSWSGAWSLLTHPVSDQLLITAVALIVWVLWVLLAVSILVELAAALRGVNAPRPWVLRPTQALAAALVAGLSAAVLAPTAVVPLHQASSPPASVTPPAAAIASARLVTVADVSPAPAARAPHLAPTRAAAATTYRVVHGDWVVDVADRFLGDPDRYIDIAALNPKLAAKYGNHQPTFPDHIEPGDRLILPADAHDRGPRRHAQGHLVAPPHTNAGATHGEAPATPPAPTSPTPAADQPTPTPTPTTPTRSPGPSVSSAGIPTVPSTSPPARSTPTTATPSSSATGPAATPGSTVDPEGGTVRAATTDASLIVVVGGFVTAGLAAGLLAAAALVWRRRRHRYRPTRITTVELDDTDLAPPLAGLTRLRHALRRQRPDLLEPPPAGPTVAEYLNADTRPALPPIGPSGTDLAGMGGLPLSAGLGLHGPGAHDAARGLLVSCLAAGSPDDPDAQGHVIVPAATLATLLGVSAVDLPAMSRLTVTNTTLDAITVVEEEIIRRTRVTAEYDVADVPALRVHDPLAEALPQVLLISDLPEPPLWGRLVTAIHLGENVDIGAVLIGAWPQGTTLTVAADGTATTDPTPTATQTDAGTNRELVVLDTDAAAVALAMLAEAHDDAPLSPPTPSSTSPDPAADISAPTPPASTNPAHTSDPRDDTAGRPTPGRIRARILGEPTIFDANGTPISVRRRKIFELLVYLGVNRDGSDRATMMETFWPDAHLKPAEASLNNLVAALRAALRTARPDTDDGTGPDGARHNGWDPVPNTGSRYHLDPACVELDWWTVLDEYASAATAPDDESRLRHLLTAIAAVNGGLADRQRYDWIDTDQEAVRRRLIKIYCHAAELLTDRDPDHARQLLDRACDLDPLNADVTQRAMRAAAALGDADAVSYRRQVYAKALTDSGIDIDDDTDHLAATLLSQLNRRRAEP